MVSKEPERIRGMFGSIAHRYDLLNHLLSLSIDRSWRRRTLRKLRVRIPTQGLVLDLCTGTGDLGLLLTRSFQVVGSDFAHPMLVLADRKFRQKRQPARLVEADALALPFQSAVFDGLTIAFGLRNLVDYEKGVKEMNRVLKPGGTLAVLEFSRPSLPVFRQVFSVYFSRVLPVLGNWISGNSGAYSYLHSSVAEFLNEHQMRELLGKCGFVAEEQTRLTGGVATLHVAHKI